MIWFLIALAIPATLLELTLTWPAPRDYRPRPVRSYLPRRKPVGGDVDGGPDDWFQRPS